MDLLAGIGKTGGLDDLLNGSKAGIESNLCTLRVMGYSQVKASCGLVPTNALVLTGLAHSRFVANLKTIISAHALPWTLAGSQGNRIAATSIGAAEQGPLTAIVFIRLASSSQTLAEQPHFNPRISKSKVKSCCTIPPRFLAATRFLPCSRETGSTS
jgi:hypothetical protein